MTSSLKASLNRLGQTEDEVVDELIRLGIKGSRNDTCSCPLAMYLLSLGFIEIMVSDFITADTQEVCLPRHLFAFVVHFDEGKYPSLVA
jgi:hypothetical protein